MKTLANKANSWHQRQEGILNSEREAPVRASHLAQEHHQLGEERRHDQRRQQITHRNLTYP
jgi:hypothetical protein